MSQLIRAYRLTAFLVTVIVFIAIFQSGCNKDRILDRSDAELNFSTDTLTFDTVFTTLGSTTRFFKVYNPYNQTARIKDIHLAGGNNSQFRMNVDGIPGTEFKDVEILPGDSMYVFVEVTVDPDAVSLPFIIADSVVFRLGNEPQSVVLAAWGQNANFYYARRVCDEVWDDDKPYVIVNSMQVDSNCYLRIQEGTQVHLSNNSLLYAYGTIEVNGTLDEPVVFQQLRLEPFYRELPGQWIGILLRSSSTDNVFNHALIKNSIVGIRVNYWPDNNAPKLRIFNSEIRNVLNSGIIGLNTYIYGENLLIFNCGQHNIQLEGGGAYDFRHGTFANFSSNIINHNEPIVRVGNWLPIDGAIETFPTYANFTNSIIYGSQQEEIFLEEAEPGATDFEVVFDHSLIRTEMPEDTVFFKNVILNQDPLFADRPEKDYRLKSGSPAINVGTPDANVQTDLDGNLRGSTPDIGAFEFVD